MQVLVTAMKGLMAFCVAALFIDDARAQVPIEEEAGTITMTGTVEEILVCSYPVIERRSVQPPPGQLGGGIGGGRRVSRIDDPT